MNKSLLASKKLHLILENMKQKYHENVILGMVAYVYTLNALSGRVREANRIFW